MPTEAKKKTVKELNEIFSKSKSAVLANYQGIPAPDLCALRLHMKSKSVEFFVTKNTLAQVAAKDTAFEALESDFKGPVSIVVSFDDLVAPAKALAAYAKTNPVKEPEVICGLIKGQKISPEGVKELADLPPKEVLVARMLSTFQGPATNFVGVFSGLLRKFVGTLEAIKEKKAG